jgi:hypothetical protein
MGGFLLLVGSALMSFLVIVPRTPQGGDDAVFWKSVADLSSAGEFLQRVRQLDDRRMLAQRLSHSFNLSRVCAYKYGWLRRAMLAGAIGLCLVFFWWILALYSDCSP